eukprot:ANDGO_02152.mRNA.3 Kinesin-related protein 1
MCAVRVRPFNAREIERNAKQIIKMEGPNTIITNPEDGSEKKFTFDFSYWSHNKADATYATQKMVFNDLGIGVLENAWKGYNVSLFAYGQTGSGKSYSMVGYGEDKGIIPQACEELFVRTEANSDPELRYKVEASMLEIYNEQVRDLFNPKNNKPGGLRVRENPASGPYVEDLSLLQVNSYKEISDAMDQGTLARTVASTNMNATSSRAHTIFTIVFTQTRMDSVVKKETSKVAKISLVDLAGSERAESTGATGDRLKEGANINKSLSALGNCISALAENSGTGKNAKKKFVPYRDSVLTWLLKESLGGNARTIMIAALSPADINFDETLSTLRYADRAKQIKNNATVNEDPNAKLIRDLRAEIERLKSQIGVGGDGSGASAGGASPHVSPEVEEEMRRLREQFEESQKLIAQLSMSDEDKKKQTDAINASRNAALKGFGCVGEGDKETTPHLTNLNEDPQLSESLIYLFADGKKFLFGRKNASPPPDVALSGLSISKEHCTIENVGGVVSISPFSGARVFVNGKSVTTPTPLSHNDRIILGNNHVFRFQIPPAVADSSIDWEFAQKEFAEAQGRTVSIAETPQESEAMKQLEEERRKQQAELEAQRKQLEDLQKKMASSGESEELLRKNRELEEALRKQEALGAELSSRKAREKRDRSLLEETMLKAIPMVNEANQIAEEVGKDTRFEIKLLAIIHKVADMSLPEELRYQKSTEVRVRLNDNSLWNVDKFFNRVYLMREVYQNYLEAVENGIEYHCKQDDDPFFDPVDAQPIGTAMVYLSSLAHLIESELSTPVLDYKGKQEGELQVEIVPSEIHEEDYVEDAKELIGRAIEFSIKIPYARGLPTALCTNVFVRYKFFLDEQVYETEKATKKTINPTFNYVRLFRISPVTEDFVKYLESEAIQFEVFGMAEEDKAGKVSGIHYYPPGTAPPKEEARSSASSGGAPASSSAGPNAGVVAAAAVGGAVAGGAVVAVASSKGDASSVPANQPTSEDAKTLKAKIQELETKLQQTQTVDIKQKEDQISRLQREIQERDERIKRLEEENKKKSKSCVIQ